MNKLRNLLEKTILANQAQPHPAPSQIQQQPNSAPKAAAAPRPQDPEKQRAPPSEIDFQGGFRISKKWVQNASTSPTANTSASVRNDAAQEEFLRKQKGNATADDPIAPSFIHSVHQMDIQVKTTDPKGLPVTPSPEAGQFSQHPSGATPPSPSQPKGSPRPTLSSKVRRSPDEEDKRIPQAGTVTKQMLEQIFLKHAMDPSRYTADALAREFKLDTQLVDGLVKHLKLWRATPPPQPR